MFIHLRGGISKQEVESVLLRTGRRKVQLHDFSIKYVNVNNTLQRGRPDAQRKANADLLGGKGGLPYFVSTAHLTVVASVMRLHKSQDPHKRDCQTSTIPCVPLSRNDVLTLPFAAAE